MSYNEASITEVSHSNKTIMRRAMHSERGTYWSSLADICRLLGLNINTQAQSLEALFQHRRFRPEQHIYQVGQTFEALYIVNSGFLKTVMIDGEGNERVLNFPMKGDLLGSDGISKDQHSCEVVALTDCDVIVIPFHQLLALGHSCNELEHAIYRLVSHEIVREHANLVTLGSLHSDARVAHFLSVQAQRHAALGFSSRSFLLRMTRREIGSYLGLTLETVSRAMSSLDAAGIISVNQRDIEILKPEALHSINRLNGASAQNSPFPKSDKPITAPAKQGRPGKAKVLTHWVEQRVAA
jgi:CRP/FNR family transcriptional regulator, anaerobic regulatory protein